ncbi:hypothetical protein EBR03_04350 [bacterium]|nr:hypothetical protein [bacterium]
MMRSHKRGDVREDGKLFWQYKSCGKELWVSKEKFEEKKIKNCEAAKKEYPKVRERCIAYLKNWRKNNKDKCDKLRDSWAKRNPEKTLEIRRKAARKYAKNNRAKCSVRENKRRQLKEQYQEFLDQDQIKIMQCIYDCRKRISECTGLKFHVDHVFPLSKGGKHSPSNLKILPAKINLMKHNKIITLDQF